MNAVPGSAQVFLVLGTTDMRKAIDGLSVMVADQLARDPLSGAYFVFINRSRTIVKVLYWDRNGFCLWQKRLERERFRWPESEAEVMAIGGRELSWILEGLDLSQVQGHPRARYTNVV
jgi:transposase